MSTPFEEARRKMVEGIREQCAAMGHPLDEFTDVEVVAGVAAFGTGLYQASVSLDECAESIRAAFRPRLVDHE